MDGESGLGCFLSTFSPPWPTPPQLQPPFYTHHKHLFPSPLLPIHSNLPPSSPYHPLISTASSPKSNFSLSLSMEKDFFPWTQNPADMNFYTTSSNWDQNDPFESALSSMVSSPAASATPAAVCSDGDGGVQLIELIGKLGSICRPSEISPHHSSFIRINQNNQSGNNSCYSTPLNSPPKLDLSTQFPAALTPFSTDPGFVERAARFSCFGSRSFNGRSQLSVNDAAEMSNNKLHRVASCHLPRSQIQPDSKDESSVSQKVQSSEAIGGGGRKRKSAPRGRAKESNSSKAGAESNDSGMKRMKSDEIENSAKSCGDGICKENSKPPEPPKDYIHVRARRGQATDSHSLAERVRREKISERMKFLQDLVPGCNKVTGKAVMLDEIINYVQSLQRQVEFLSMKLATVNPRMDSVHMEALLSKEILQSRANMYPVTVTSSNPSSAAFPYAYPLHEPQQCISNAATDSQFCNNPSINGFCNSASQVSMWEDELHNVVQMGFSAGSLEPSQMKMEP